MTPEQLAARVLADVTRWTPVSMSETVLFESEKGELVQYADALAAIARHLAPGEWKPIETAPRNGEWFKARTEHGTVRTVHFADAHDRYPISGDGEVWSTAPVEWMPLTPDLAPGDELVEQATAALEGVTDGPWETGDLTRGGSFRYIEAPSWGMFASVAVKCEGEPNAEGEANARFIAFARQWVPEAAARLSALTAERDRRTEMHECAMSERDDATLYADEQKARAETAETEAATLRDRLARMEEALDDEAAQEVDRLRLQAFATNLEADRMAYFKACSQWFQNRHTAALTDGGSNG